MITRIKNKFINLFSLRFLVRSKLIYLFPSVTNQKDNLVYDKKLNIFYQADTEVGNALFWQREFEKTEVDFFAQLINKNHFNYIIDIGANIGWHTIQWVKHCPDINKIYAIEPSKFTRRILEKNLDLLAFKDKTVVLPYALSQSNGTANFFHCNDNAYSSLKDTNRKKVLEVYKVNVLTLDSLIDKLGLTKVDFIKIDVEGFEFEVCKGAVLTLQKYKPDLFIEIFRGENSNLYPEETINFLTHLGYNAYVFNRGNLIKHTSFSDSYYNYYFTFNPEEVLFFCNKNS